MTRRRITGEYNGKHYDVNVEIHEAFSLSMLTDCGWSVVDVSIDGKHLPPDSKELNTEELHDFIQEKI